MLLSQRREVSHPNIFQSQESRDLHDHQDLNYYKSEKSNGFPKMCLAD